MRPPRPILRRCLPGAAGAPGAAGDALHLKPRGLHDDADVLPVTPDRGRVGDAVAPVRQRHEAPVAVVAAQHIAAVDGELEQAVEGGAIQGGVRQGGADFLEQRIGMHRLAAGAAQNVLRHHIERAGAWRLAVELAVLDGGECRLAFQRLEAVRRHEKRAARNVEAVVRAANPLQQPAHALRRRHLDHRDPRRPNRCPAPAPPSPPRCGSSPPPSWPRCAAGVRGRASRDRARWAGYPRSRPRAFAASARLARACSRRRWRCRPCGSPRRSRARRSAP